MMKYGFRNKREELFPLMLVLEITNVCNYRCIHCPYPEISKHKDYKPKFMDWTVYQKIVDETAGFKDTIFRFVCDGEPMMHPDFLRMVEYVKVKNISPVCVTTNGYFLSEYAAKKLIDCGCDIIEVSLDALYRESYDRVRAGGDFDRVVAQTKQLIKIRDTSAKDLKIMVSAIDQPLADGELEAFKQYWQEKADKVIIRKFTSIGGLVDSNVENEQSSQDGKRWPCPLLWRRLFVNVDGYAEFCVDDWLDESIIGDLRRDDISSIWKSDFYQNLRNLHNSGCFEEVKKCAECCDWTARTWDYDYFHAIKEIFTPSI
ncbi:MAG: radical SAM protein [Candidatus Omnitrophota bacterium]